MKLDAKIPAGPLALKWDRRRFEMKLVNPANKRKFDVIVVGTGLAGAAAAASLAELGYKVKAFCYQDSPRRAHSIAAQGGINAAKNYQNDGDSVHRLFYDTIKGGDFRAREANVHRLAQVSVNIIDQCVAQGVPFAREYGGLLANRSFGGAQVSRTFYARGQTGQQLLLGAYQALCRQIGLGKVKMFPRTEMLDLVVVNGHAKGIVTRACHRRNHGPRRRRGDSGHRRLRQCFLSFHQRQGLQRHRLLARLQKRRGLRQPVLHADSSHLHPRQRRSSIQADAHVGVLAQRRARLGAEEKGRQPPAREIPEDERDYFLERKYPSFGNLAPRDISSRAAKEVCDEGRGVGPGGLGVYLDFADAIKRIGEAGVRERYGNLFDMYEKSPAKTRISGRCAFIRPCITPWAGCGWIMI
jgi:succinate dehydrogenase / fumarate reductase flavoprotein subunit